MSTPGTTRKKKNQSQLITDNQTLRRNLTSLKAGDRFIGRVRIRESEEHLLLMLVEKGVIFFPSALSQLTARSKVLQASLYPEFMVPETWPIHDIHDLMERLANFSGRADQRIITKQDRSNAGLGIHLWDSFEQVYNQASLHNLPVPFVLQPFYPDCRDIRVIILGEYIEAYFRHNPHNFRNNLHFGGRSEPCTLSDAQLDFCRKIMAIGKFPYAHIDLMITPAGHTFLGEINLRGGIRGARISTPEYQDRLAAIHQEAGQQVLLT